MKTINMIFVTILLVMEQIFQGTTGLSRKDQRGPTFRVEPPARVEFANSSGTELRCGADGVPTPKVSWQTREGTQAGDVPGLRYQRDDGSLIFPPFSRPEYRQDVHDTVYQCVAANDVGIVLSREVHVRGVIKQRFSPQVYDDFVVRGNTAVMRCHLPSYVREHVGVDSWIRSDSQVLKHSDTRARSYTVLRSGELLLHDVKEKDLTWSYRCQTQHRLTGEMVVSPSSGKVIVTEPHVSTLPRVTFSRSQIRSEEGSSVQMPCVAQGNPPPSYRWMKEVSGVLQPVKEDSGNEGRVWLNQGTLNIMRVQPADEGQYQCIVRNSIGERRIETSLVVTAPLAVSLQPKHQVLSIGQEATFNCNISGYPVHTVSWKRGLKPLVADTRVRLLSRDVLHIASVRREDAGMFQCFAHNDRDSAQGTSQLSMADVSPSVISAFPERTVHPSDRVSMKCVSTGNPIPRATWYLDNSPIESRNSRISSSEYMTEHGHVVAHLNITEVLPGDSGDYKCEVMNEVGSASQSARLNVYGPPFVRTMSNVTAVSGRDLNLQCPYGGHPVKGIRWFKSGILLPLNHRQKVSQGGDLTIQGVQRSADEGMYSCTVRSPDGSLSATGSTHVSVVVSPVIDSRYFLESVTANELSRIKLMCTVIEGDPPLRFHWLKNGKPFLAHGDTTVQTFEDSSIVTFKRINSDDRGMYTCVATNIAASTNMTTHVIVHVSPQWTVEPNNATVILGKSVWLHCATVGFPTPSTLWKKLIYRENAAGDFTYVHSSPKAHRYNNGTLVISEVDEGDAGSYLCQASNGIGAGLSKIVDLKVLIPPRFQDPYHSQNVMEESNASLRCVATGDPPIDITWQKNKESVDMKHIPRYSIRSWSGTQETASELYIIGARRLDTGMFTCLAASDIGTDEAVLQLIVQGQPDPPTNISVTNVTSRSISFQWDVLHNGNSQITGSVVQYKTDLESSWQRETSQLIVSGGDSLATLRGLVPVTTYSVRILAENAIGRSKPSDVINVTTEEEAPAGAPTEISVLSTGAQSIKVLWMPPPEDTQNGYIRGYYVGYRQSSSSPEPYHYKRVERTTDTDQQATYITGLKPFTKYDIVVKAYNSAGTGPKSSKVSGKTLETAPPTSPVVHVQSTTTSSIEIKWENDVKDKLAITEYTLHYKADEGEWMQQRVSSAEERFVIANLRCGTAYHLYMTASNSLGTGEPSASVTAKTSGGAPVSPPANVFLNPNRTSAVLRLNKWQNGGCPIQYFIVQYRAKHQTKWAAVSDKLRRSMEQYVIRHLSPDKEYVVLISAYSEAGMTQAEYQFKTMPEGVSGASYPAYGKRETELPFYKNVALLIPIVVTSLLLVIVVFTVVLCLRKHSEDRRRRMDYDNHKPSNDSLMMSDISKQVNSKSTVISSHYVIPSGNRPEYAEPYMCKELSRQESEAPFATIKRHPGRPIYMSAAYKQECQTSTQPAPSLECGVHIDSSERQGSQPRSGMKANR